MSLPAPCPGFRWRAPCAPSSPRPFPYGPAGRGRDASHPVCRESCRGLLERLEDHEAASGVKRPYRHRASGRRKSRHGGGARWRHVEERRLRQEAPVAQPAWPAGLRLVLAKRADRVLGLVVAADFAVAVEGTPAVAVANDAE